MPLTPKQQAFVNEYLTSHNATQAAIQAGYSQRSAYSQGQRLLKKAEIAQRLEELKTKAETDAVMTATEVLERLSMIARGEGLTETNTRQGLVDLPPPWSEQRAALVELAKYHGLQVDRSEITVRDASGARERLEALLARRLGVDDEDGSRAVN